MYDIAIRNQAIVDYKNGKSVTTIGQISFSILAFNMASMALFTSSFR